MTLSFRPMTAEDLRLLHEWQQRPHVKRWWSDRETYEQVVEHYLPAIEGQEPADHFIMLLDERPIGMIETYLVSDYPEYEAVVGVGAGVAGVDLLIGEEALIGRGLGSEVINRFVEEVVFASPATVACIAGPEVPNIASIRAFEKAGFRREREFLEEGRPHVLVRRDRQEQASA